MRQTEGVKEQFRAKCGRRLVTHREYGEGNTSVFLTDVAKNRRRRRRRWPPPPQQLVVSLIAPQKKQQVKGEERKREREGTEKSLVRGGA